MPVYDRCLKPMLSFSSYARSGRLRLPREPVRRLYQEDIARPAENLPHVVAGAEVSVVWLEPASRLLPHEEQSRTRPILPTHDRVAAKRVHLEVRIRDRERRRRAAAVRIDRVGLSV